MRRSFFRVASTVAALCAAGFLVAAPAFVSGCTAAVTPAPGQLTVVLRTNMKPGKDFDRLRLSVQREGGALQYRDWTWSLTSAGGVDGTMKFPSTVGIVGLSSSSALVTVRVEATLRGAPRLARDARLYIPAQGNQMLPVLIDWLCMNDVAATCNGDTTCIAGTCAAPDVDSGSLMSFEPPLVFGGESQDTLAAGCFDVIGTFANAREVTPTSAGGTCSFPWSEDTSRLNVAARLPANSAGICTQNACLVALDEGSPSGWTASSGRVAVPPSICARGVPLVVSTSARSKTEADAPCGSWSSVGSSEGASTNTVITITPADGGAPFTPDSSVQDASTPDAGSAPANCEAPYLAALVESFDSSVSTIARWSFRTRARCTDLTLSTQNPHALGLAYDNTSSATGPHYIVASADSVSKYAVRSGNLEDTTVSPTNALPSSVFDIVSNGTGTFAIAYESRSSSGFPASIGSVFVFKHSPLGVTSQQWGSNTGGAYGFPLSTWSFAAYPGNQGQALRVGAGSQSTSLVVATPTSSGPQTSEATSLTDRPGFVAANAYRTSDKVGHYAVTASSSSGKWVYVAHTSGVASQTSASNLAFNLYQNRCGIPVCDRITRAVANPLATDEAIALCESGSVAHLVLFGASTGADCTVVSNASVGGARWRINDVIVVPSEQ